MKAFLLEALQYRVEKEPQREEGKMQRGFGRWPQTIQDAAQKDEDDGVNLNFHSISD